MKTRLFLANVILGLIAISPAVALVVLVTAPLDGVLPWSFVFGVIDWVVWSAMLAVVVCMLYMLTYKIIRLFVEGEKENEGK